MSRRTRVKVAERRAVEIMWQVKIRLGAELAEKLICRSGQACFIKPEQPKALTDHESCTLVWAKRHSEASNLVLAQLLKQV